MSAPLASLEKTATGGEDFVLQMALLARTEAHVWMPRAQQPFLPAYVPLDFPETSVRSALTAANLTLASTVATVQTMA